MPTATSFTALGEGNGFPDCSVKIDVSSFDYWVTLGGFKQSDGGSPTENQINDSLINAMNLVWNCYSFSWTATSDGGETASFDNDANNEFREPFENVCYGNFIGSGLNDEARTTLPNGNNVLVAVVNFSSIAKIQRFYNGDSTDEDNFVGYGIRALGSHVFKGIANGGFSVNNFSLGSREAYYFGVVDEGRTGLYDFSYVEVSGIHFVLRTRVRGNAGNSSIGDPSINFYTY